MTLYSPPLDEYQPNTRRVRIGVLASGSGSNFEVIVEAARSGVINADIVTLVFNNPGAKVEERARRLGIPSSLVNHREFGAREEFDRAIVESLIASEVEWVVMAGWMRISTGALLGAFPDRVVNLHPSLLPSFRGSSAVKDALEAGVKVTGCTVHLVRLKVDDGPIVGQAALTVDENDDVASLHQRIHEIEHVLFPRAIARAIELGDLEG